ncbi:MAG: GH32 C-terminal domain-containing protein [Prevotella sp.]|nr:GH32 C-terminal domain-containing protein [Prevotella sp.]
MRQKNLLTAVLLFAASVTSSAQQAAQFNMSLANDGTIAESVSGKHFTVQSQLAPFSVEAIDGDALRFDGYSNYVRAEVPVSSFSAQTFTVSVTLAAETYPMMNTAEAEVTPTYATVCGNLDESAKRGFALQLSSQGDLRFQFGSAYAGGFLYSIAGTQKLPRGSWNQVMAVLDKGSNLATLYLNGESIGTCRMSRSDIAHASSTTFFIGKDATEMKSGPFLINTFCGLIDDITISNAVVTPQQFAEAAQPDFCYPASRYESSLWRPQFHAMPTGSWTNETHGMTFSDGRYHVFFQKNANGPYMARLHWGHISSSDLCVWQEEPIAIAPSESYDIKGCWSGCVYDDKGTPAILYTAVDNARAVIAKATPEASDLISWQKQGILVNGRPSGLSDDFRDPYFFEANGQQYIIVGTSKNNVGACTLHRLEGGSWTNDGAIFFQGSTANQHGTFWEMPTITPMDDGRWLFTCTPLNTGVGVRTLCWVGTIGTDGRFTPNGSGVQYLELAGISRDGYGLLSPTIYQKDGKTLLLGIVPDKLPTQTNFEMGWAHNYSLPREISLDANDQIVQQPYSGLSALRTETTAEYNQSLSGNLSLSPVSGRHIELLGEFTVASGTCGFNFLKSGSRQASLVYDTDRGTLTLDLTQLDRTSNDQGVYKGTYTATLPQKVSAGEQLKLHVYLDGSIADIFVNDRWAYSVRLFPTDASAVEAEAFTTAAMQAHVSAWVLDPAAAGDDTGITSTSSLARSCSSACYDLQGRCVNHANKAINSQCNSLSKGIYIQDGHKFLVK